MKRVKLDQIEFERTYSRLPSHFYHLQHYQGLKDPYLISLNTELADRLGLDLCSTDKQQLVNHFGGGLAFNESASLAMKYTGHQFGIYNPDLGDGRGLLLGEFRDGDGELWDFHLKGAGRTPYSRFGDGRAVLRSSIREYLASIAMKGLGVATTEALTLVGSRQMTQRDGVEPCAALLRVSRCHIRFGHFEYLFYSRREQDLKILADYCINRFYPQFKHSEQPYLAMYQEISKRSIQLVAQWQCYGFVHGVLNTDNMSLIGETFDYGPFTFLDWYKPDYLSNQNDHKRRYTFESQPSVIHWNLACLAQAFLPLVEKESLLEELDLFDQRYISAFHQAWYKRLAIKEGSESALLVDSLLGIFKDERVDTTRFMRALIDWLKDSDSLRLYDFVSDKERLRVWLKSYRVLLVDKESITEMEGANPIYLLRNYMLEEVIREAHQGDYESVNRLASVVKNPFLERAEFSEYTQNPPDWAAAICLTCSS